MTFWPTFLEAYRRVTGSEDTSLPALAAAMGDRAPCEALGRVQLEICQAKERAAVH
jgi:hypothetical protein